MRIHSRKSIGSLLVSFFILTPALQIVAAAGGPPPLYDDLGDLHYEISANTASQAYFDQGMRLYYAFNHAEAITAFREAQRLDPDCAMCWWGEALAFGPNINLAMSHSNGVAAYSAAQKALSLSSKVSSKEQQLINALAVRYEPNPGADRTTLDSAYADAMQLLAAKYPHDDEIVVLYAEAVMDLNPWDYWTGDRQLRPRLQTALAGLEQVMERSPYHPGACHFYIHAVEEHQPEQAVACAEKLATLMPGAGHLVHMPGHIYIRVGRYLDAIKANEHAVHADETYIRDQQPAAGMYTDGYYPHNYDFLAFAALMIGREQQAIEAADKLASLIPTAALHDPAITFPQHYVMRPALVRIRFERWHDILGMPDPGPDLPHARAIWTYAQGRARLATGDMEGAHEALADLQALVSSEELATARLQFNSSLQILSIAEDVLAGMIAYKEGDLAQARTTLWQATNKEAALFYGEPPEWTVPVQQEFGEILLATNHLKEAEQVFRGDLELFRENTWSLRGLGRALRAQGKTAEASAVEKRLQHIEHQSKRQ